MGFLKKMAGGVAKAYEHQSRQYSEMQRKAERQGNQEAAEKCQRFSDAANRASSSLNNFAYSSDDDDNN